MARTCPDVFDRDGHGTPQPDSVRGPAAPQNRQPKAYTCLMGRYRQPERRKLTAHSRQLTGKARLSV